LDGELRRTLIRKAIPPAEDTTPASRVTSVYDDIWTAARGLLADQRDGDPRLMFWKRIVRDKVTTNRK
jgi:hypothetical protein